MALGIAAGRALRPGAPADIVLPFGIATAALCLLGMWDDCKGLSAWAKLPLQILVTLPLVLSGFYPEQVRLFGESIHLGWLGAVFTVGWLVLVINAMNLIDGMDGLASVTGIVISSAITVMAARRGNFQVMVWSLSLAGGLAGFLVHNRPPAKVFLGDSGSMVIGLVVAFLALRVSTLHDLATVNASVLTLLLFVPLLDTGLAVVRRILKGQNILHGDHSHLHHQLLDRGFSVWRALAILGGFCSVGSTAAFLTVAYNRELLAWASVAGTTAVLVYGKLIAGQELRLFWQLFARTNADRAPLDGRPMTISIFAPADPGPVSARPLDTANREWAVPAEERKEAA
jgi:UDP-GlcNAc:undecaprenyl-phosphate GlcNAc-1-phosphate transferase